MEENNQDFFHIGGDYLKVENEDFPQDTRQPKALHAQTAQVYQTDLIPGNQIGQNPEAQAFQLQQNFWKSMGPLMGMNNYDLQSTSSHAAENVPHAVDPMLFAMQSMVSRIVSPKEEQITKREKSCDIIQNFPLPENVYIESNEALHSTVKQEPYGPNDKRTDLANTCLTNINLKVKLKSANESKDDEEMTLGLEDIKTENNAESDAESCDSDKTIVNEEYAQHNMADNVKSEKPGKMPVNLLIVFFFFFASDIF